MIAATRLQESLRELLDSVRLLQQRVHPHRGLQNLATELVDLDHRSRLHPVEDRPLLGSSGVARILGEQLMPVSEERAMVERYRRIEGDWASLVGWGALRFDRRTVESCAASPGAELADAPLLSTWCRLLVISVREAERSDGSTAFRAFTSARRWRLSEGRTDLGLVQVGTLVTWLRAGRLGSVRIDPDSTPVVISPRAAAHAPERAHLEGLLAIERLADGRVVARSGSRECEVVIAEPGSSAGSGPGVLLVAPNAALAEALVEVSSWDDRDE